MDNQSHKNPSQTAFGVFKELVGKDEDLTPEIVTAVLNDLSSDEPSELNSLTQTLAVRREGSVNDSNKDPEGK